MTRQKRVRPWLVAAVVALACPMTAAESAAGGRAGIHVSGVGSNFTPSPGLAKAVSDRGFQLLSRGDMAAALAFSNHDATKPWTEAELQKLRASAGLAALVVAEVKQTDAGGVAIRVSALDDKQVVTEFAASDRVKRNASIEAAVLTALQRLRPLAAIAPAPVGPAPVPPTAIALAPVAPPAVGPTSAPISGAPAVGATAATPSARATNTPPVVAPAVAPVVPVTTSSVAEPASASSANVSATTPQAASGTTLKLSGPKRYDLHVLLGEGADTLGTFGVGIGYRVRGVGPSGDVVVEFNNTNVFGVEGATVTEMGVPVLYSHRLRTKDMHLFLQAGLEASLTIVKTDGMEDSTGFGNLRAVVGAQLHRGRLNISAREYVGDGDNNFLLAVGYEI